MRILVLIIGLLGVGGAALAGSIRLNLMQAKDGPDKVKMDLIKLMAPDEYEKIARSTYALLGAAAVGLVACVLAFMRMGVVAGVLFLLAYAAPLVFLQEAATAIFPAGLALAGVLSFLIRRRPALAVDGYGAPRRDRLAPDEFEDRPV